MKLRLEDLNCEVLNLQTDQVPATEITLREITDGSGALVFSEGLTKIEGVAIRNVLAELEIPIGTGRLYTDIPATISHVACDGRVRNGFAGEVHASILDADGICLDIDAIHTKAHLRAEGLVVKLDGRGVRLEVGTLTLKDAQVTLDDLFIRLGVLSVSGLKVSWEEGKLRTTALKAHAKDLHIKKAGACFDIAAIDLPEGLEVGEQLKVREVLIGAVEIAVEELVKKASQEAQEDSTPASRSIPELKLDTNVFDTINGRVDADMTVSVTLPVIGKRVATHLFRIPIEGGIVNYLDFEKGLSDLEDAFIDIRVRGDKLVLERDIPIIPGLNKPIVTWDLSPGERVLASQHLVRIGTLLKYKVVGGDEPEDPSKKSKLRLHRLDFDSIAVHLSLDETALLKSGEGSLRVHIDALDLAGSLHFDPDPEDEVLLTALAAKAKGLGTVAQNLRIGNQKLSGCLQIGAVDQFQLGLDEVRPTHLRLALKNIALSQFVFDLVPDL